MVLFTPQMSRAAATVLEILSMRTYGDRSRLFARTYFGALRDVASLNQKTKHMYEDIRTRFGPADFDAVAEHRATNAQEGQAAGFLVTNRPQLKRQARRAIGWWW